eukprot:scaffold534_cov102-Isochrysis_galbana.AAC.1
MGIYGVNGDSRREWIQGRCPYPVQRVRARGQPGVGSCGRSATRGGREWLWVEDAKRPGVVLTRVTCGPLVVKPRPSSGSRCDRTSCGRPWRWSEPSSSPNERWSMWCDVLTVEKSKECRLEWGAMWSVPGARDTST